MAGMGKELLNLIPNGRDWTGISAGGKNGYGVAEEEEEKKLELRLGPPGGEDCSVNSKKVAKCANIGSKRGLLVSAECKTKAFQQQQQQQCEFIISQQSPERKKVCGFAAAVGTTGARETAVTNRSLETRAPATPAAPVVGWPPIRSFRKNIASTSKTPLGSSEANTKIEDTKKNLLVKINMDGIPIGRKVDLKAYDSYDRLSLAVDELFRGLLAAQTDALATGTHKTEEKHTITGILDGSSEYTLVYEDNEGDRMLAGDVPWNMFVSTAKRLRVLKRSELSSSTLGTNSRKRTANEC